MSLSDPYWSRDEVIMERTRERDDARAEIVQLRASVAILSDNEILLDEARAIARDLRRSHGDMGYAERLALLARFDALPWAKEST